MTGYDDFNYPAFFAAEERLKKRGYQVFNPARNQTQDSWHDYLRFDIKQLMDCDAIYMLYGYYKSKGSMLELLIAKSLDFEIQYETKARKPNEDWIYRFREPSEKIQ